jgi:hypothetical protein
VPRTRTTKKLAQRIDLNYFRRPTPFKRAKLSLSILIPVLAVAWIALHSFTGDSRVYSSGRMSPPHAVLEKQCSACHLSKPGGFSSVAADRACLSCHDGPEHHVRNHLSAPDCATCHVEHHGRVSLSAVSDESCALCHSELQSEEWGHIRSLEQGHPEIAVFRHAAKAPDTIRLNHAMHMKPIRQGPNGPLVQLECSDCHRNYQAPWRHALNAYPQLASYQLDPRNPTDNLPQPRPTCKPLAPSSGRELMRPVSFAYACSACHLLTFDKRFDEGVPHDRPEVIHAFLVKKLEEYINAHPADVRVARDPQRDLTGQPLRPVIRVLTPAEWVAERTANAEDLLWRKTCKQCHQLLFNSGHSLPEIAPANATLKWLTHAKFDHDAHRGFSCINCHQKALTSTEATDLLIPGIANCKTCHAPGPDHAESRCFECHTYHDWSKRKEVHSPFTLPTAETVQ